jgi:hypothetical protein
MMYFVNFIVNRCFQYKTTSNYYIFSIMGVTVKLSRCSTFVQPLNFLGFVPGTSTYFFRSFLQIHMDHRFRFPHSNTWMYLQMGGHQAQVSPICRYILLCICASIMHASIVLLFFCVSSCYCMTGQSNFRLMLCVAFPSLFLRVMAHC